MKYNFDDLANLRGTNSSRYIDLKEGELNLTVADMDFMVMPEILESIKNRINIKAYTYTDIDEEFFTSFISYQKKRHNNVIYRSDLLFSTSVIASLDTILDAYTKNNDKVMMFTPIYNVFYSCLSNHHLDIISIPFLEINNRYEIDFPLLENKLKQDDIKLFILCNPHNPSGKIYKKEELDKIIYLMKKYDILIVSDEIHSDIVDVDKQYYSLINYFDIYHKIIVLNSASKAFNLAGMQSSIVIIRDEIIRNRIEKELYKNDVGEPNFIGPYASIGAWKYGLDYNYELRLYLNNNKKYLSSLNLDKKYGLILIDGGATYLLWYKIPSSFSNSEQFATFFYQEEGIKVSPGSIYGKEGENFIRINIATSLANIKLLGFKLDRFLDKYKKIDE